MIKFVLKEVCAIPRSLRYYFYLWFNRFYLKKNGVSLGMNFKVVNHVYFNVHETSQIVIGDNFMFTSSEAYNPLCRNIKGCVKVCKNAVLLIGNNVGISSACIWVHKSIRIGNNVKIGGDCILIDSDCHSLNYLERRDDNSDKLNKKDKEIVIEDDVLIGARCIILKGVHVGARSVIGAGSVVTKDIPCDCIAAGNPCKVIKRFD